MSVSLFTDPVWSGLFGDELVENAFSAETTLAYYLAYEVALTNALQQYSFISKEAQDAILAGCKSFQPDIDALNTGTARDGLPVPDFVRQLKTHIGLPHASQCHKTSTSQDVMDTALALTLQQVSVLFNRRLSALVEALEKLRQSNANRGLKGRTRMQAALPISATDRVSNWVEPLQRHQKRLDLVTSQVAVLQVGGPVGTSTAQKPYADAIATHMAQELGLGIPQGTRHTQRDHIVQYAGVLSMISGSLGKVGIDIALMVQQGIDDIKLSEGGGSSAMPHKNNPIRAEQLVTLARYNAAQVSAMHSALVHEQERSGMAWALEWMVLPAMCMTTARGLLSTLELIEQIEWIGHS